MDVEDVNNHCMWTSSIWLGDDVAAVCEEMGTIRWMADSHGPGQGLELRACEAHEAEVRMRAENGDWGSLRHDIECDVDECIDRAEFEISRDDGELAMVCEDHVDEFSDWLYCAARPMETIELGPTARTLL